jgi:inner membrane protein
LPLVFYLVDLGIARARKRPQVVKLSGLLLASIIVSATHPLLDWTNNYGVRFLLPWNSRWFYGDFVFILDPFMWLILGGAAFLLTSRTKKQITAWVIIALIPTYLVLLGPASRAGLANVTPLRVIWITAIVALVILFKQEKAEGWGAETAIVAFGLVVFYLGSLLTIHFFALREAKAQASRIADKNSEHVIKIAAMPTLANPFRWTCVFETERAAYRFDSGLGNGHEVPNVDRYEKADPPGSSAVAEASRDRRAIIFLGFARFPVARVIGEDCATQTLVQLADLRYTEPGSSRGTFALEVPVDCPIPQPTEAHEQR